MFHIASISLIAILALNCLSSSATGSELPPEAYGQLLNDAQEVYRLRVVKVEPASAPERSGLLHAVCDAEILVVERSKAGRRAGDRVHFATYSFPPEVREAGITEPKVPPLISKGWQGIVYLNPPKEGDVLQLAAYGRSFVAADGEAPMPPNTSNRTDNLGALGVTTRPITGGGLFIVSTRPGSLADDMGLRPGDKLLRVNARAVNIPSDVKAALVVDSRRMTVTITRGQKPLEISLVR